MDENMNPFDTIIYRTASDGRVFTLHWKYRFGPLVPLFVGTAATGSAAATTGLIGAGGAVGAANVALLAGTGFSAISSLNQGSMAAKIGKYENEVKQQEAKDVEAAVLEKTRLMADKGRRLLASQTAEFAASGIRVNTGVPLIVAAKTEENLNADIARELTRGYQQADLLRAEGRLAKTLGTRKKRMSYWDAAGESLAGLGMAYL